MIENTKSRIIAKIKKLVAQSGRNIIWRAKTKDNDISEKIAQKIQKNSYDFSLLKKKDTYTPPYQILAKQLQVEDDQIFRAAAHAIANIALGRPKYAPEIRTLLEDYLLQDKLPQSRRDYIRLKLFELSSQGK
ncbi:MAG: hypothetical protein E7019_01300 [Alphaproteobacteria bacterium]|nr:hypothetical protein [Alphaproteobacteria bacterium]